MYNYNALARRSLKGSNLEFWIRIENLIQNTLVNSMTDISWDYYTDSGGQPAYYHLLETNNIDFMFQQLKYFQNILEDDILFEKCPELLKTTGLNEIDIKNNIEDICSIMYNHLKKEHDQIISGEFTTLKCHSSENNSENDIVNDDNNSTENIKELKSKLVHIQKECKKLKTEVYNLTRFRTDIVHNIIKIVEEIKQFTFPLDGVKHELMGWSHNKHKEIETRLKNIDEDINFLINDLD